MKNKENEEKTLLDKWSGLYKAAVNAATDRFSSLDLAMEQYLGSDLIDGSQERAKSVRNITYEIIESQVSSDIPLPKVDCESISPRHEENARAIERLCRAVRSKLPFEDDLAVSFEHWQGKHQSADKLR